MSVSTSVRVWYGSCEYIQIGFDIPAIDEIPKDCRETTHSMAEIGRKAIQNVMIKLPNMNLITCYAKGCKNKAIGHFVKAKLFIEGNRIFPRFTAAVFCCYDCLENVKQKLKNKL